MKEPPRDNEFDSGQYERSNQNWTCGNTAAGKPCPMGPDRRGRCRATAECRPLLENGSYVCTRKTALGKKWPCEKGPLSDGSCSHPIAKCAPVRTLLARRRLSTIFTVLFAGGLLLAALCGPFRPQLISPGALSIAHATDQFARKAQREPGKGSCAACHHAAETNLSGLLASAFNASPGPFQIRSFAVKGPPNESGLDLNCLHCHSGHSFHQVNVARQHSCSACHLEHQGSTTMSAPKDANCHSCHANPDTMQASCRLGEKMPVQAFDYQLPRTAMLFKTPRPEGGHTNLIQSFPNGHPQFQFVREHLKDTDTLKFNHQRHLNPAEVSWKDGSGLHCQDCHKPDAAGIYYRTVSYQDNCGGCHRLQFDVENSDLLLPHGNPDHVRDFLRSLSRQYADYGAKIGKRPESEIQKFVQNAMTRMQNQFGSGEALEQRVFFSDSLYAPTIRTGLLSGRGASTFPGCAKCHPVTDASAGGEVPVIIKPEVWDRWLSHAKFDHSKHLPVSQKRGPFEDKNCLDCHAQAQRSKETSDILLPSKEVCARCHSTEGGVAHNCSTCHTYHLSPTQTKQTIAVLHR